MNNQELVEEAYNKGLRKGLEFIRKLFCSGKDCFSLADINAIYPKIERINLDTTLHAILTDLHSTDINEVKRLISDIEKHHNDSMLKSGDVVIYGGKRYIYIGRSDSTPDGEEKIVLFSPDTGLKFLDPKSSTEITALGLSLSTYGILLPADTEF